MKVSPAWEEARIAGSPSAKVQAIGYDSAGRLQYRYHDKYRERKEREKFERILESETGRARCVAPLVSRPKPFSAQKSASLRPATLAQPRSVRPR